MTSTLNLPINGDGFTGAYYDSVEYTATDGGLPSTRIDVANANAIVNPSWTLSPSGFNDFLSLATNLTKQGANIFLCAVAFDYSSPVTVTCKFIPGSIRVSKIDGLTREVAAQLEIVPGYNDADDTTILDLVADYGVDSVSDVVWGFTHFVTYEMPRYLH